MKKFIQLIAFSTFIIFASCKGKDGAIGPQGVAGASITGQTGPQGLPGNANVKSRIFSATSSNWSLTTSSVIGNYYEATGTMPEITQAIHDKGLVLAFMSEDATQSVWLGMPTLQVVKSGTTTYTSIFKFKSKVGNVIFTAQDTDGTTPGLFAQRYFKVVAIEGTGVLPPNIDPTNYKQVAKYLNLDAL
jgi:hypothetical protein